MINKIVDQKLWHVHVPSQTGSGVACKNASSVPTKIFVGLDVPMPSTIGSRIHQVNQHFRGVNA